MSSNKPKSLCVTYFLWLIGGYFGLHHFYLHRDRHAFISWMSFGCYFGAGWFRDLWRIPEYVRDANEDTEYLEELTFKMRKNKTPPSSTIRHCGTVIIADVLGYLVIGAIPVDHLPPNSLPYISALLAPLGVAIGLLMKNTYLIQLLTFLFTIFRSPPCWQRWTPRRLVCVATYRRLSHLSNVLPNNEFSLLVLDAGFIFFQSLV